MDGVVYVDVETNGYRGLDTLSKYHRIIQFGALGNDFEFERYVNPGVPISQASTKIHHIDDKMVQDAPTFDIVWAEFLRQLDSQFKSVALVAHGGMFFDRIMIMKELDRFGVDFDSSRFHFIDTDPLLRRHIPNAQSHNLGSLIRQYLPNYDFGGEHTALADCKALKALIESIQVPLENVTRDEFSMVYDIGNYKWVMKEFFGVETPSELAKNIPSFIVYRWIKNNVPGVTEDQAVKAILRIYNFDVNTSKKHIF